MAQEDLEQQVNQIEEQQTEKKKRKSPIKYILNISLVLIVTALSVYFALRGNFDAVATIIQTAEIKYILIIVGLMTLAFMIRGFILFCFARLYTRNYKFHQSLAVDQIGVFYNAVTPGSSGGQIMQAYTYKKQGVNVSSAVSILAMYSIVFQIVLILFGLVSFIFKYDFITALGNLGPFRILEVEFSIPIWPLTILGFILNLGVILIVLLMGYWHKFHNFIMGPIVSFLAKIKIVKKPDETREKLRIHVENFKIDLSRLLTNIPFFILIAVCFALYLLTKFSIPYFCGLALDPLVEPSWSNFWDSIFLSNYHQMVTGLVPLPGSAGVSELFYTQLFDSYFSGTEYCRASLLLWRSLTFTIPLVISGFVTAFYRASPKDELKNQNNFPDRGTFVYLQNETYAERSQDLETIQETTRLSHEAIMAKLKAPIQKKKNKKTEDIPSDVHNEYIDVNVDEENNK